MTTDIALSLGNLPAEPNSFVGRERDLAELGQLLSDVRALTLCGPGGIGKTRLGLRLAGELNPLYPDGTWLAELADISDPAQLPGVVAAALSIRAEADRPLADTLTDALRSRRLLLLLDTCEHVVEACAALVQQLVGGCPWLRVIATSREPLRVRGETVWRVPPLALPAGPPPAGRGADLARHEAVRLFAERAAAVRPSFVLDADNTDAVTRLVRMLDGMPLAIELAAARVRALSVEQIAERLGDRFQLLASGDRTAPLRQQTLRAAVDWSYELLTGPEQVLLRRLSVFSGWNLEMAEEVCAGEGIEPAEVLDLLAALIDKSLVTLDGELAGDFRYRLLDIIRQYARGRLAESGEQTVIRLRHRDFLVGLAERSVGQAFLSGDPPWPARVIIYAKMAAERANLLTALAVSRDRGDAEAGLRMCTAMYPQWVASGEVTQGAHWFDELLGLDREVSTPVRARALTRRAGLAFELQDYPTAASCAAAGLELSQAASQGDQAEALRVLALVDLRAGRADAAMAKAGQAAAAARAAGLAWDEGLALIIQAVISSRERRLDDAQRAYQAALEVLRDNNAWGIAQAWYGLGSVARARHDHAAALRHYGSALAIYREIDASPEIARCLAGIGWVALADRDMELATSSLTEGLQLSMAGGRRLAIARSLEAFAVLHAALGAGQRAVRLAGASQALREAAGDAPGSAALARIGELVDDTGVQLSHAGVKALLAEGKALTAEEAAQLALERPGPAVRPSGWPASSGGAGQAGGARLSSVLTSREEEIAALIARGMSNRAIAAELGISPATAARHVANILTKLDFSSRVQVATWVTEREPPGQD